MYRVNRSTGQVSACQYAQGPGVGVTRCFGSGEGAGPLPQQGDFSVIASNMQDEGGVFRVDWRTGLISVCYVRDDATVCTPPR
jgi:hypothetical protein